MSGFAGRVCAVTGAGSGIGRALALGLARRGARLALADVDDRGLADTATTAEALGAEVHGERVDVAERDAVLAWAEAVAVRFGAVHQVYNNAGIAFSGTVLDSDWEDYDRVLNVNLWGVIHGTKAFLPHLIASGEGHVVNISSLNGFLAQGEMTHYCASKFGVRGFTEALRVELLQAGHPVGVTSVHPGGIRTNIATNALEAARAAGREITAADEARHRLYTEKLLKMDPDQAAGTILRGVARGKGRILVGGDAKAVDAVVRVLPALYPRALVAAERRVRTRAGLR